MLTAETVGAQNPRNLRMRHVLGKILSRGKWLPRRRVDTPRINHVRKITHAVPMEPVLTKAAHQLKITVMVVAMILFLNHQEGLAEMWRGSSETIIASRNAVIVSRQITGHSRATQLGVDR